MVLILVLRIHIAMGFVQLMKYSIAQGFLLYGVG
jgi:hypothetical protein